MTAYYVRSAAAGAANGTSWTDAYTTIATAISGKAAGDIFYVSEDHAESTAGNVTWTFPGTHAAPNYVYCVNHAGTVPPVTADLRTTGSAITTGGTNLTINGAVFFDGMILAAGNGSNAGLFNMNSASSANQKYKNCTLKIPGTAGTSRFSTNTVAGGSYTEWENTTVQFGATSGSIRIGQGPFVWKNTPAAIQGATIPTQLFTHTTNTGAHILLNGLDLSAIGSGKTLLPDNATAHGWVVSVVDCDIDTAVTRRASGATFLGAKVSFVNCHSSNNFTNEHYDYTGALITEGTIVRTPGASDGTQAVSWKIDTTANSSWSVPFEAPPIAIWNTTIGSSVNVTVEGIWGSGSRPNDEDIWIEVTYLGTSGSPVASVLTSNRASLASAATLAAGSGSWGGSTSAFKMTVAVTPQVVGLIYARVRAAKASSTFYVDPLITIT